jgi:aminopeptidase N
VRRIQLIAVATATVALAGCTPDSHSAKPAASPSAAPIDYSAWAGGKSTPVVEPIYPKVGNPAVDVLHYGLDLAWAADTKTLTGQATVQLRAVAALTAITLDFSAAYTIDGVTVDGRPATGTVTDGKLSVPTPLAAERSATLLVKYHGTPTTVPMPSHRGDAEPLGLTIAADGSIWTMQEPYGAATWYPVNDIPSDKALYDLAVTAPTGWSAVASGTPKGQEGNVFRYTSTDPVASYLTTLAVGPFKQETVAGPHALPINYWYVPGRDDKLMAVVRRSPTYLTWLEQRLGPYPFPTAGVVVVASASGMETQQMVTLGATIGGKDASTAAAISTIDLDLLHEYSHQWFGDAVTPASWKDLWLSEGFATYLQSLYNMERDHLTAAYWEQWARGRDAKLRRDLGPPGSPRADSFAEGNVYICPALMLHQIHNQIGDDAFFSLARDWAQQHRGSVQDRSGFVAFVNQHTGKDFTSLINTWLDSPTTP